MEEKRVEEAKREEIRRDEAKKEEKRLQELKQRNRSPARDTRNRSRTPDRRRNSRKSPRRRSRSAGTPRRYSPVSRKRSAASKSRSPIARKAPRRTSRRRSTSRSLSYSPARRNPERYRDILDKNGKNRSRSRSKSSKPTSSKKLKPVVKLIPRGSDKDSSDNEPADFQIDRIQESEKELNVLKALKSGLAAKAKETLEKKIISESCTSSLGKNHYEILILYNIFIYFLNFRN